MNKNTRWALAIAGVVVLIVAAVLISTKSDDTVQTQTPATESGQQQDAGATDESGTQEHGDRDSDSADKGTSGDSGGAAPRKESGGGGVEADVISPVLSADNTATVRVKKGQTVQIRGRSAEAAEMHVHGYDNVVQMKPNKVGKLTFKAKNDGMFEIELHTAQSAVEIGTLRVDP